MFSTRTYDRASFAAAAGDPVTASGSSTRASCPTTVPLAEGCDAVCAFVNDDCRRPTLQRLAAVGVRHVALRSAGLQPRRPDVAAAGSACRVVRVPAYSPNAVAEHTIALILAAQPPHPRAHNRVRDSNFSPRGPGRLRPQGQDRRRRRDGQDRRPRRPAAVALPLPGRGLRSRRRRESRRPRASRYVDLDELWPQMRHHLAQRSAHRRHPPPGQRRHDRADASAAVMLVNTGRGPLIDTPPSSTG